MFCLVLFFYSASRSLAEQRPNGACAPCICSWRSKQLLSLRGNRAQEETQRQTIPIPMWTRPLIFDGIFGSSVIIKLRASICGMPPSKAPRGSFDCHCIVGMRCLPGTAAHMILARGPVECMHFHETACTAPVPHLCHRVFLGAGARWWRPLPSGTTELRVDVACTMASVTLGSSQSNRPFPRSFSVTLVIPCQRGVISGL
jgi:hypothetical protein